RNISRRLLARSVCWIDKPVMFPPGRASEATRPVPTGSPAAANTIGMTAVAFFAAMEDGVETVRADARECDIGMQLGEIAKANPGVAIGSYPFFVPQHGPNTNVVLRAHDAQKLAQAKREVEEMLERVRRAQSKSA